jgi:hypothetical protein
MNQELSSPPSVHNAFNNHTIHKINREPTIIGIREVMKGVVMAWPFLIWSIYVFDCLYSLNVNANPACENAAIPKANNRLVKETHPPKNKTYLARVLSISCKSEGI